MIRFIISAVLVWVLNAGAQTFIEMNGLVTVEVESAAPADGWVAQDSIDGFTGSTYYTWTEGNSYEVQPAGNGVLTYRIKINTPGTYTFKLHCYHDFPEDQTLENDCWFKVDGGSWTKLFQSGSRAWSFNSLVEVGHELYDFPTFNLGAGYHTVSFSGRSYRFSIDRFHLYLDDVYKPTSLDHPEALREGQTLPDSYVVAITGPAPGTELIPGQQYTLTGTGTVVFWKYDIGDDGIDITSAGSRNERAFTVPADAVPGESIAILLTGTYGTDKIVYSAGDAAGIYDVKVGDAGIRKAERCWTLDGAAGGNGPGIYISSDGMRLQKTIRLK